MKSGVSCELSRKAFESRVARMDSGGVKDLRIAFYKVAHRRGLMAVYAPVVRRMCGSESVMEEHIWEFVSATREKQEVRGALL